MMTNDHDYWSVLLPYSKILFLLILGQNAYYVNKVQNKLKNN